MWVLEKRLISRGNIVVVLEVNIEVFFYVFFEGEGVLVWGVFVGYMGGIYTCSSRDVLG